MWNVASDPDIARLIILLDLKHFAGKHSQHLVSVFFDLEKAYDTTWKYGIMKDLHGFGLRGCLPNYISIFLHDRSFKVWVGSTFSDSHPQEMGVTQGSNPFSVKINSITQCLKPGVDCSLYVDDMSMLQIVQYEYNRTSAAALSE